MSARRSNQAHMNSDRYGYVHGGYGSRYGPSHDRSGYPAVENSVYGSPYGNDIPINTEIKSEVSKLQDEVLMLKEAMQSLKHQEKLDSPPKKTKSVFTKMSSAIGSLFTPAALCACLSPKKKSSDPFDETTPYHEEFEGPYSVRGGRTRGRSQTRRGEQGWRSSSRARYGGSEWEYEDECRNDFEGHRSPTMAERMPSPDFFVQPHGDLPIVVAVQQKRSLSRDPNGNRSLPLERDRNRSISTVRGRPRPNSQDLRLNSRSPQAKGRVNKAPWDDGSTLKTYETRDNFGRRFVATRSEC